MKAILKKTILVDLDGVLNTYDGKYDKDYIPPIKDGAFDFIKNLSHKFKVVIFTTRNSMLVYKWVVENGIDKYIDNVTNVKEPAYLIIDDRCINFNGNFDDLQNKINNFSVWYKK